MVKFRCQRCSQKIAVNDEGIGVSIDCPTCREILIVPPRHDLEFLPRASSGAVPMELVGARDAFTSFKAAMRPHLERILASRLVGALLAQRRQLIDSQDAGTEQLAAIEQRMTLLQMKFQRRLSYYGERIETLEAENAELARQLTLAQKQLRAAQQPFAVGRVNLRDAGLLLRA